MIIRNYLDELLEYLIKNGSPLPEKLTSGMSRDEIKEKLSFLNRDIPETVYQLFEWKTGRRYEDEKPPYMLHSLCPLVEFYTLDDCIELYKIKRDFGVDKKYFPLFYNIGMDVWYIDLEDGAKSKVFFYNPGITLSEDPMVSIRSGASSLSIY